MIPVEEAGKANSNNKKYQFWGQDNHPIELSSNSMEQKLEYIHENPVKDGIVLSVKNICMPVLRIMLDCRNIY